MKLKKADQIARWRLCIGCGVCKYICPEHNISLIDVVDDGIRPSLGSGSCQDCGKCVSVCPGIEIAHARLVETEFLSDLIKGWGPILEIWEGYATDPDIRYQASSGGVVSALSLYSIEKAGMHGVLHSGSDKGNPYKNKTLLSLSRTDILSKSGSRYLPASPCDGLEQLESAPQPCVFIGKPCDISGLRKAQAEKTELINKTGVAIGIFCAGTPATQGTMDLLKSMGINHEHVEAIRYRGRGWPGNFSVRLKDQKELSRELTYLEAWGFLQRYRPYRCYLCPDGTSELADISCGDPWYREIKEGDHGYSLVLVRTEKGRKILHGAMEAGYISLKEASPKILEYSQKNLLSKRSAIFGRLLAMKLFFIPTPRLKGFYLFENWMGIPVYQKIRSIFGTIRRIIQRGYYKCAKKLYY